MQRKYLVSDSPGLVDFAIWLVNSDLNLPNGQVKYFGEFNLQKNCKLFLLFKKFGGIVKMMFGLINVSFSLPEWQAVKMTFFAPCYSIRNRLLLYPGWHSTLKLNQNPQCLLNRSCVIMFLILVQM